MKMDYTIIKLNEKTELKNAAAEWFHEKWGIPYEAYYESMTDSLKPGAVVPSWYIAITGERIVGGMGVIENDFHPLTELTPNVCAVFTEPDRRREGIAGALLNYVCSDMAKEGIHTLYLATGHTGFYERYGWEYYCAVQCDGDDYMSRMYIHRG